MLSLGQTHRPLRPVLVPLPVVMETLKLRREAVAELVECGELRWVWDISRENACRVEHRYWLGEIFRRVGAAPLTGPSQLTLADVVEHVIGRAQTVPLIHSESVADIIWTTRTQVHTWLARKELEGHIVSKRQFVTRASLTAFLTRRIVS